MNTNLIDQKEHLVLYQKYRPKSFSEVIGQDAFKEILLNSIKNKQLANAYIFSGFHGVGKTTLARIFAKAINCLHPINNDACNACENCLLINENKTLDIVEIDAASNNGVDNVRQIIENCSYLPVQLKYKVYIIDEAHMITNGGWNAFLKTLENPSRDVIFIFCTTEVQKIPKTILSRCQQLALLRLSYDELKTLLNKVTKEENIKISADAKGLLCELADGSARDMLSILEQLLSFDKAKITVELINEIFSLSNTAIKLEYIDALLNHDLQKANKIIKDLVNKGINLYELCIQLLEITLDIYLKLKTSDKKVLEELIKPSIYQTIINKNYDIKQIALLSDKLQALSLVLKKNFDPLTQFNYFIFDFIKSNESISNSTNTSNINQQNHLDIQNEPLKQKENVDLLSIQKPKEEKQINTPVQQTLQLEDFIQNKHLKEQKQNQTSDDLSWAKQKIASLDESWIQPNFADIRSISTITDVTQQLKQANQALIKQQETQENLKEIKLEDFKLDKQNKQSNKKSILPILDVSDEQYFLMANAHLDQNKMNVLLKSVNNLFMQVKQDQTSSYVLLKDALVNVSKVVLLNNCFLIFVAANIPNKLRFNTKINIELLKEIHELTNSYFYVRAFAKNEFMTLFQKIKGDAVDENSIKQAQAELEKVLNNHEDDEIERLTKDMLFRE